MDIKRITIGEVNLIGCGGGNGGSSGFVPPIQVLPSAPTSNKVVITEGDSKNVHVIGLSYTLKDFYVTSGQAHSLAVGQVYVSEGSSLTFHVNRKNSADATRWFNDHTNNGENACLHQEKYGTNFALLGDLTVTYTKNGPPLSHTFQDLAFSQFWSWQNFWNLGGPNLPHIDVNTVCETGTKFILKRSNNTTKPNVFYFYDYNN
jgi:hypothetical protein